MIFNKQRYKKYQYTQQKQLFFINEKAIFFYSKNRCIQATPETNVKKNYENEESCAHGAATPPDNTDTPTREAHRQATAQPTNQEQPSRPQSQQAKRGHAAATRSEILSPGAGGTRWTHKANQPKTAEKPKADTTEEADGKAEAATAKN